MGKLYLFVFPFVNLFNFSTIFTIPVIVSFIGFIYILINKIKINNMTNMFNLLLIVLLFFTFISLLLNIKYINYKMINHELALVMVILLFYFTPLILIERIKLQKILRILFSVFLFSMFFAIFEFISRNILHINYIDFLPRASVEHYEPTFWAVFIRARSLFEESGHYASYMAVLLPFILLFLNNKPKIYVLLLVVLLMVTSFCVFSTAFFILIIISIVFLFIKNNITSIKIFYKSLILSFFVIVLFTFFNEAILNFIDLFIMGKLQSNSADDRTQKALDVLSLIYHSSITNILFGHGMGSYEYLNSKPAISVYLNLFRDLGLFGLSLFIGIFFASYYHIKKNIKKYYQNYFYISILMIALFYLSIGNYFYPHFWIPFVLMYHKEVLK